MSSGQGSARNLAQGSQEAFRALINSLAPEAASAKDGKLTPEVIEKLSEKLKELVGEDAVKSSELRRNERACERRRASYY
ncbi:hypothetical protein P691DRAFT_86553 [Macrolepiota fuliginosa MF-IS2]|uniref:Uncharacterized protein n=1 Tax=Macrolepiota fuliginosa MF-IS2 TaxID=1400762 RepID=A0A9P5XD23_9AGAR|nr:hypothetical protein P691DRAFT_86553 [Macrolepiota fuliginosa MF-IS2]